MGLSWAIVVGLIGCVVGFFTPKIAYSITVYKQKQRNQQVEKHILDHWLIKVGAAIINGMISGIYSYFSESFLGIIFIIIFAVIAIIFSLIDWRIRIIPNELVLISIVLGLLYQLLENGLKSLGLALICMVGLLAVFIIIGLIAGLDKIGAGDVKLIAVMGLVLGYPSIFAGLLVMSIALLIYIFGGMLAGKLTHVSMFPYAPFMMLGMICGLIYGSIY
jgi:leader peptidase (prepilin peptidase) / N-methyltransferase